jgi:phage recombination protein Bet
MNSNINVRDISNNASQSILEKMKIDADTYDTLKNSIYPGAKDESIMMALSYCRAANLDILHKPVHIVPMSVNKQWRDVIMPGIALYRIQASRSGFYAGKDAPEFGPDVTENIRGIEVTYPEWCIVSIKKIINGNVCVFSAKEYWKENFASKKSGEGAGQPNTMWVKRPYGQLAKCAEAQALRMGFPELVGGMPTAEEMEGKTIEGSFENVSKNKVSLVRFEPLSQHELVMLRDKMQEAESEEINICNHFKVESIEAMSAKQFSDTMRMLQVKIDKKRKEEESLEDREDKSQINSGE